MWCARVLPTQKVDCILAMTATATLPTEASICQSLHISPLTSVIRVPVLRPNLRYYVSTDRLFENGNDDTAREEALCRLLSSSAMKGLKSIIVYVMLQRTADKLA